jgi:hypothetical protein
MTHSYTISGITCTGCVTTVKSKLLINPDITGVEIKSDGSASISMSRHLGIRDLQASIGNDSQYKISENTLDSSYHNIEAGSAKSWFATYKPLLIIALYITGISALLAQGSLHLGMNYFMAGFFLVFSFFKFLDLKAFASSYAMYDLLAMKVPAYGLVYPFIELFLGIAYASGIFHLYINWVTLIVMGFSSIGVIRSVTSNQNIRCACLGAVFNLPMSTVTIVEDLLMVAMAVYMLAGF